jgi:hypothetical protein
VIRNSGQKANEPGNIERESEERAFSYRRKRRTSGGKTSTTSKPVYSPISRAPSASECLDARAHAKCQLCLINLGVIGDLSRRWFVQFDGGADLL